MKSSTKEESASYVLNWSLALTEPGKGGAAEERALKLEYEIEALEELYVSDRLWDYDKGMKRVPDRFGVYRFVGDDSLRLVFAQPPHPPNVVPHTVYAPLYSRVLAGEKRRVELLLELPIDEYSSLARDITEPTVVETLSKVHFVLGIRTRADMEADPVPPPRETAEDSGYIVHDPKLIVSSCEVSGIAVKRRTGYMARFALRGEPAPEPMPLP